MNYYLSNSLGFFIQLAPCALMIFLPFPEESLRISRKRILTGTAVLSGVLAALFPLMLLSFPTFTGMGNLIMLVTLLLILAAYVRLVREDLMKKILVFFVVLFYAITQYWLVNSSRILLPPELFTAQYRSYSPITTLLYAAMAAVSLPITLLCVIRPMEGFIREMEPEEIRREFLIAILTTTVIMTAMMAVSDQKFTAQYYLYIVMLELLLILGQVLIYWILFRESLRRKRDNDRRRILEIQQVQYEKISQEMENARQLRHDLRHHLNVLGALNAQGRQEEISEYLKQYGSVYERLRQQNISGDPVVDGLLEYYLTQAREESIAMEYEVDLHGTSGLEAMDMTVLLGNCLENALKALQKLPPDRRKLSIDLRSAKSMILIRIQNSCAETDDSGTPTVWEAFAGHAESGYLSMGLNSVDAIAQKYNGSALFQRKDGTFTTRIILNPRQGDK